MAKASGLRVLGAIEKPLSPGKLTHILSLFDSAPPPADDPARIPVTLEEVSAALENGDIVPHFQPQAEFGNGKIVGVEALARWRLPDGRWVPPSTFVPVLEAAGLVDALTTRMLVEGCRWHARWKAAGVSLRLSVNVSAHNLSGPEVADRYERIVREHGAVPDDVILEITESSVMSDTARGLAETRCMADLCSLCLARKLETERDHFLEMCEQCSKDRGVVPLPRPRRPANPCRGCKGLSFVRAIPRESGGENRQAPMTVTYAYGLATLLGLGTLEMYICKGCGLVDWYCLDPQHIPIGPQYMTEEVDYKSDVGPYR
jgi:hypothetical protein